MIQAPIAICLYGDLGAGKTALSAEIIKKLTHDQQIITSPTFNIVHTYATAKGELWHMDLYRLKSAHEVLELGFEDALNTNIMIIEWPELVEHLLPTGTIKIHITFSDPEANSRNYSINN